MNERRDDEAIGGGEGEAKMWFVWQVNISHTYEPLLIAVIITAAL